jgi:ribonuclease P protein component
LKSMENTSGKLTDSLTFRKEERLCSKKLFDKLFSDRTSFFVYPLKVIYVATDHGGNFPVQAAFAASKKIFRKAVDRNLLKRRMREAYRLNKQILYQGAGEKKLVIIFIYIGKEIINFQQIEKALKRALNMVSDNISGFIPNP